MSIKMFAVRVDLREGGVEVGEGRVDNTVKKLPKIVVIMRILGWYKMLYILRTVEEVEDGEVRKDR
jgi:hypothetical protein